MRRQLGHKPADALGNSSSAVYASCYVRRQRVLLDRVRASHLERSRSGDTGRVDCEKAPLSCGLKRRRRGAVLRAGPLRACKKPAP